MAACRSCGEPNPAHARFCLACGSPLAAEPTARESRKTVTVVFCDFVESTSIGGRLETETYRRVISRYFVEASRVLERHGGTVEKFIGDAVMAVFGIPTVHEDDALRAVRAAGELREALGRLNADLKNEFGIELGMRIGVDTGEVVAGDPTEGQAFATGEAVVVAQRLEASARPGEILIGETTHRLVRDAVLVEPVGPLDLKGVGQTSAFRLVGVVAGAPAFSRRLDSPLVGRERELALLGQAFRRAVDERTCHLFTMLGAAGVGKSRLVNELLAELGDEARIFIGRCVPYGEGITFWPLREIVRQAAGLTPGDSPQEARERLGALLAGERDAELVVERLAGATALADAETTNEETFWATRKLLEHLAQQQPLVVAFDDLQWAEPAFLDLVDHLADWTRDAPLLLICVARPELLDERLGWGGGKLNATSILLEPLGQNEVAQLIENLLGSRDVGGEVPRILAKAGEGNPLFLEEMLGMLVDQGRLRDEDGTWRVDGELSSVDAPPTIQALLAARLDQLDDGQREVVERASVFGKLFSRAALVELGADEAELDERLGALVRKDLIRPDRTGGAAEESYRFRHILIRDAAYLSLAKEIRADLHERFADALEGDRLGRVPDEIVGYHLEQAHRYRGELTPENERVRELATRAADRLVSAGRRAFARRDMPAAVGLLTRATLLLRDDDPARLEIAPDFGRALVETGELTRADAVLGRALEEARAAERPRIEWLAKIARSQLNLYIHPEGSVDQMARDAESAIAAFEELGDEPGLARAWALLAEAHWWRGRFAEVEEVLERALVHAQRAGEPGQEAFILNALVRAIPVGPRPVAEALERCREILEQGRGDRILEAQATSMVGILEAMLGHFEEARACCARSREISEDLGLRMLTASLTLYAALVELLADDPTAAEAQLREGYESLEPIGEKGRLSTISALLARTIFTQQRYDEAEHFTAVSEDSAAKQDLISQIMWRQTRARVLARKGTLAEAETLAREAVELAESTDFLNIRGEALLDLAEVLCVAKADGEAAKMAEAAIDLFERKGNLVAARKTRRLLDRLSGKE